VQNNSGCYSFPILHHLSLRYINGTFQINNSGLSYLPALVWFRCGGAVHTSNSCLIYRHHPVLNFRYKHLIVNLEDFFANLVVSFGGLWVMVDKMTCCVILPEFPLSNSSIRIFITEYLYLSESTCVTSAKLFILMELLVDGLDYR
jgi:hypothetical protein